MDDDLDFLVFAEVLRRFEGNTDELLEMLASRLAGAIPGRVTSERKRRLFSGLGSNPIVEVTVDFGDERYSVHRQSHGLTPSIARVVGGIRLASSPLSMADWVEALSRRLAALAGESDAQHEALKGFLERS